MKTYGYVYFIGVGYRVCIGRSTNLLNRIVLHKRTHREVHVLGIIPCDSAKSLAKTEHEMLKRFQFCNDFRDMFFVSKALMDWIVENTVPFHENRDAKRKERERQDAQQKQEVFRLYEAGVPTLKIANKIRKTSATVLNWTKALPEDVQAKRRENQTKRRRAKRAQLDAQQKQEAFRLYAVGDSFSEIAHKVGKSHGTIRKWTKALPEDVQAKCREYQIKRRRQERKPKAQTKAQTKREQQKQEAFRSYKAGESFAKIAGEMEKSAETIRRWVKEVQERVI